MHDLSSELPQFDLRAVMSQLVSEDPVLWTPARLTVAEREYRRFLLLSKTRRGQSAVPSRSVDAVWHRHILNTVQYARDCQSYFGYFLHHNPNHNPSATATSDREAWLATLAAYRVLFGTEPREGWKDEGSICDAGGCDHAIREVAPTAATA